MKKRLFLVDDHALVRQGLTQLINAEPDLVVCGQASNAQSGLQEIRVLLPDLVLVDLSLQSSHGLDLIKDIFSFLPKMPVLVLSMHDESIYAERALRAGAAGFVMKSEPFSRVVLGIRRVLSGQYFVSEIVQAQSLKYFANKACSPNTERSDRINGLSDREMQVFECLGQGKRSQEIAAELHVSVKTVETHRAHLKKKLQIPTSPSLVRYAVEWRTLSMTSRPNSQAGADE